MGLELGLGLGLNKGGYRGDAYNDLVKLSTWFIDPARPQGVKGTADAFNTAQVNPIFDRKGNANVTMTNVAWTNLDGYRVETINGKTNVYFNLEGADTFGALSSASAPNPTGSDDFWQLVVFRPEASDFRVYGLSRNNADFASFQFALVRGGLTLGDLTFVINGSQATIQTIADVNLKYVIYGRINGRRFANLNGTEVVDEVFVSSVTSRLNTQLGCRSNSADGSVKTLFSRGLQGICAMQVAPQGTIDKAKVVATVAKAMKQIYGLGV